MLALPDIWRYSEDEERLELEAAFAELNEEFRGYEAAETLLSAREWQYLLPRISGQGRALVVNEGDYDAIDDPEPCEYEVALALKKRRAAVRARKLNILRKEHEIDAETKKNQLKKKKFVAWMENQQEKWQAELEELEGAE